MRNKILLTLGLLTTTNTVYADSNIFCDQGNTKQLNLSSISSVETKKTDFVLETTSNSNWVSCDRMCSEGNLWFYFSCMRRCTGE